MADIEQVHDDHVQNDFTAAAPYAIWVTDITEQPRYTAAALVPTADAAVVAVVGSGPTVH